VSIIYLLIFLKKKLQINFLRLDFYQGNVFGRTQNIVHGQKCQGRHFAVRQGETIMSARTMAKANTAIDIVNVIKAKLDAPSFDAWFRNIPLTLHENNSATLFAANRFNLDFILATFGNVFSEIESAYGIKINVELSRPELRVVTNDIITDTIIPKLTEVALPQFIESDANAFAVAAIKKVAAGRANFSPLVIYGPSGSGKTMLLDLLKNPGGRATVIVTTGAEFVQNFVRSIEEKSIFAFKDTLRKADMLVMDDVQILAGKRASAEEFRILLDDLVRTGKTVVLTSNIAPGQITGFDKHLVSLLSSGLSVDLSAPCAAVRAEMLIRAGLSVELAETISARAPRNGHVMSGIVKKIEAWRELDCGELNEQVLEKLLGDVLASRKTQLSMVKEMAAKLGLAYDDIASASRTKRVVFGRQKIMAALKMSTSLTLSEIGRLVGDRDHASVLYALGQIEKAKQTDMLLASEIDDLIK